MERVKHEINEFCKRFSLHVMWEYYELVKLLTFLHILENNTD